MAEMSVLERWLVNSPARAWLQRGEVQTSLRWAAIPDDATILDMGCGPGVSTALIRTKARPRRIAAFDFDPAMVARARRRLGVYENVTPVSLAVADAARMPYRSDAFDAVFEAGVVHHVPDWRSALREVGRVLRPGGRFYFAEPSRGRLRRGLYRMLRHAPESMFDAEEWKSALRAAGLELSGPIRRLPLWDIAGIALKT